MSARSLIAAAVALAAIVWLVMRADGYQLFVIALVGLTAIVGIGLNVLLGLTGQISLGHVAFYAIGAYTVGILTTRTALGFWLALPLATLIAGVAGALLAIPALRVRGPYLAMVTIAFGFVVEQGAAEWSELDRRLERHLGHSGAALVRRRHDGARHDVAGARRHDRRASSSMRCSAPARGAAPCGRCATRRPRASRSGSIRC